MKNAEKYAEQIAHVITETYECPTVFVKSGDQCDMCALNGNCNSKEKIKEWLLQEATS